MAVTFLLNTPQKDISYILDTVLIQVIRETDGLKTARIFINGNVCVTEKKMGRKPKSDGRVTRQREKPNAGKERGTEAGRDSAWTSMTHQKAQPKESGHNPA